MSGHSKWSTIKHKKGAADAKRGKLFTKLSQRDHRRREGGRADPAAQPRAPERDREGEVVLDAEGQRSSARSPAAPATDADAAAYETIVYEGYGPDGVAVLVEALTDNRNRTASDVRHTFAKNGGNLGTTGAVAWLFERRGVVLVDGRRRGRGRADARRGRGRRRRRRARRLRLPGLVARPRISPPCARRSRRPASTVESAELTMVPKTTVEVAEEAVGEEADPADRGARGERRRPGRLRELRHPRAGARGRLRRSPERQRITRSGA